MFSHGKTEQKFQKRRGKNMSALAFKLPKQDISAEIVPALRDAANNNAKLLALLGDVGPDTAKNWLEGRNLPALSTFINMARECRELRAVAIKLMDPESEFDPDFMRACMELAMARAKKFDQ